MKTGILTLQFFLLFAVCGAEQDSTKKSTEESSKTPEVVEKIADDLSDTADRIFQTFTGAFNKIKESFENDEPRQSQTQKKLEAETEPLHIETKKELKAYPEPHHIKGNKELKSKNKQLKIENKKEIGPASKKSDNLESIFGEDSDVIFETQE